MSYASKVVVDMLYSMCRQENNIKAGFFVIYIYVYIHLHNATFQLPVLIIKQTLMSIAVIVKRRMY